MRTHEGRHNQGDRIYFSDRENKWTEGEYKSYSLSLKKQSNDNFHPSIEISRPVYDKGKFPLDDSSRSYQTQSEGDKYDLNFKDPLSPKRNISINASDRIFRDAGTETRRSDFTMLRSCVTDGAPYYDAIRQLPRTQSLRFDDCDQHYEADDEHAFVEPGPPVDEVGFFEDREQFELQEVEVNIKNWREHSCGPNSSDESSLSDDNDYEICHGPYHSGFECESEPRVESRVVKKIKPLPQSPVDVMQRIESVMEHLFKYLNDEKEPILCSYINPDSSPQEDSEDSDGGNFRRDLNVATSGDPKFSRSFGNLSQSRSFTSICLVMSFIHALLLSNRTTTTREVYYVFVTHFRSQRECDSAILDVAKLLGVSRRALGLSASPKGWFCGCVEITRKGILPSGKDVSGSIDGTALSSIQGLPITREWVDRNESGIACDGVKISISSKNAKAILVIEKEGVYNRLSEERLFDRFPCILVTGKGFPDLATRALVHTLHKELNLPVLGLCDCNPYGISVLGLYHNAGNRMGVDGGTTYGVPIRWLGLRPSHVAKLEDDLPQTVFQKLTELDHKRIDALLDESNLFLDVDTEEERREEIVNMMNTGYKVELEALYWLGPDYMSNWIEDMLLQIDEEGDECGNVAI